MENYQMHIYNGVINVATELSHHHGPISLDSNVSDWLDSIDREDLALTLAKVLDLRGQEEEIVRMQTFRDVGDYILRKK